MSFGEKLAKYLKENKMDQKELAKLLGVKEQTISAYITNKNNPTYARFMEICNQLKINANYFMDSYDENIETGTKLNPEDQYIIDRYKSLTPHDKEIVDHIFNMKPEEPAKIYYFPVYEQDVAAGSGQLGFDQKHTMKDFSGIDISKKISYGINIIGTSMETDDENTIPDKSTVLVTTEFDYNELIGEAVIANINGVLVCKEYNIAEDGHLWLKSRNRSKSDEDRHIRNMDCIKIIGRVVKVISP